MSGSLAGIAGMWAVRKFRCSAHVGGTLFGLVLCLAIILPSLYSGLSGYYGERPAKLSVTDGRAGTEAEDAPIGSAPMGQEIPDVAKTPASSF